MYNLPNTTSTYARKAIQTAASQLPEEERLGVSRMLAHSERTAQKRYRVDTVEAVATQAATLERLQKQGGGSRMPASQRGDFKNTKFVNSV